MGSSQVMDNMVDIYINTNKQFYIAGQCVQGQVYLNVKTQRQYSNLCLRFQGLEYVRWSTGSGKNRRTHSNTYKSYQMHNLLVDFHGVVNQGQYVFPFAMMLPNMLCGSYLNSQNCFIKYILKAQLVHGTQENNTQRYEMYLNILEPPRMAIGAVSVSNSVHSQCCGCCTDYGTINIILNSSKNFVVNGDSINISGMVDNTQGKDKIQNWAIAFQQRRIMISSAGRERNSIDQTYPMLMNGGIIQKGTTKQFNFNAVIPPSILNYTAIGRVTGRYYTIHLSTQYGCCTQTAYALVHVILHSRTPMIVQKKQMPPPQNWAPQVYPKLVVQNMKPYIYNPLPGILFRNMPGGNVIMQTNQDTGYPQMNESYQHPLNNDFMIPKFEGSNNYAPVFYQQDMFTQAEKQQQGYYQPNFNNKPYQQSDNALIRKL